jgi:hypothetical protein
MTDDPRYAPSTPAEPPPRDAAPDDLAPEALEPKLGVSELDATQATGEGPTQGAPPRRTRVRSFRATLTSVRVLAVATAVLGVIAILLGLMVFAPSIAPIKLGVTRLAAEAQADADIETVASRFARNFVTISYRTLDADFDRILRDATGSFRNRISEIPDVIRDPYVESKGVSRGRVLDVAVLSRAGETATVRVVVSRTIQNEKTPTPRAIRHSLELTVVSTAEGWKVADASQLPTAPAG